MIEPSRDFDPWLPRHGGQMQLNVNKLAKAKGNHTLAVKALGHKLARASYYVMRDQVEFDPARLFG